MVDFSIKICNCLLTTLINTNYSFQTVLNFIENPKNRTAIMRHDVDRLPENALEMAKIEHEIGAEATYYFRAVPESWDDDIIREIASLGHEIGYHYENLSVVGKKRDKRREDEVFTLAIDDFRSNLEKLRKLYPVKTICMHGSPLSRWDNRALWEKYDYRDFGIIAEPYFDIDFDDVLYLTDTGRRWDGTKVSVRDKVKAQSSKPGDQHWPKFHSTFDIIEAVEGGVFPERVMINAHPQRWHDKPWPWAKELIWQNVKNVGKAALIQFRRSEGARVRGEE